MIYYLIDKKALNGIDFVLFPNLSILNKKSVGEQT